MTPTPQQAAFVQALIGTTSHLALVARAGCGKTSTILLGVDAYREVNPTGDVLVCAFNKAIQREVEEKLKAAGHRFPGVQAQTAHGMGWGLVRFAYKLTNDAIDDKKVHKLVDAWIDEAADAQRTTTVMFLRTYRKVIVELVSYAKQEAFGFFAEIGDVHAWVEMAQHYDVDGLDIAEDRAKIIEAAQYIYKVSLARTDSVDFDDMVLLPLVKGLRVNFKKDLIIVDEAQDLSRARWALIRMFLKPHGRAVVVGDDRQAIYGFAGAAADSLPSIIEELGATVLPLTATWRCPKAVVAEAQKFVPDIEAAGHYLGEVTRADPSKLDELIAGLGPTDAVLCRNMAPLVQLAYQLIRAGKPAKVEGRAIGQGLIALVRKWKVSTIAQFLGRLSQWEEREISKAMAKGQDSKAEEIEDRAATLRQIAEAVQEKGSHSINAMVSFIESLFADGAENATILATYHRSKGREWPRVILWEHAARCPSKMARQPWQKLQEDNLSYVAITRAQRELVYAG